jgi:hypothetical protein
MKIKAVESNGFEKPHISEGLHHAEFISISDAPDGKFGARIALDFVVYYSKTEKPVKIGRVFGKKLTPKAQLWEALESIGAKLEVGKEFDVSTLIGNRCRVMIEDYKSNEGKVVSGITKIKTPGEDTDAFIEDAKINFEQPPKTDIVS